MKSLKSVFVFSMLAASISGCTFKSLPTVDEILIELNAYRDRVVSILDKSTAALQSTDQFDNWTANLMTNTTSKTRAELQEIYDDTLVMRDYVELPAYLYPYQTILSSMIDELEHIAEYENVLTFTIDVINYGNLKVTLSMLEDDSMLITLFDECFSATHFNNINIGFENELLFIRDYADQGPYVGNIYLDFLEDTSLYSMGYTNNERSFMYSDLSTNSLFRYTTYLTLENNYTFTWYNPESHVYILMSEGELAESGSIFQYVIESQHGPMFQYTRQLGTNSIRVHWDLMQATGWDSVTYDELNHRSLYREDTVLVDETTGFSLNLQNEQAFVGLNQVFYGSSIPPSRLNLSYYGMNFGLPLSNAMIQSQFDSAFEDSAEMALYKDFNAFTDDLEMELYSLVDIKIRSWVTTDNPWCVIED